MLHQRRAAPASSDAVPATSKLFCPFTWDAWLLILAAFVFSGIALWFIVSTFACRI